MSMEIARSGFQPPQPRTVIKQFAGDEMHHVALLLHRARHAEQTRAEQLPALAPRETAPDDDVDGAGLVFQGDENCVARRTRTLPAGDDAGSADMASRRNGAQLLGGDELERRQALAQQREGMTAQG